MHARTWLVVLSYTNMGLSIGCHSKREPAKNNIYMTYDKNLTVPMHDDIS